MTLKSIILAATLAAFGGAGQAEGIKVGMITTLSGGRPPSLSPLLIEPREA